MTTITKRDRKELLGRAWETYYDAAYRGARYQASAQHAAVADILTAVIALENGDPEPLICAMRLARLPAAIQE